MRSVIEDLTSRDGFRTPLYTLVSLDPAIT